MESVKITLHTGDTVTWRREKDGLKDVRLAPSGALVVYVGDERMPVPKHAYSIGLWIEFDVEYDA